MSDIVSSSKDLIKEYAMSFPWPKSTGFFICLYIFHNTLNVFELSNMILPCFDTGLRRLCNTDFKTRLSNANVEGQKTVGVFDSL